MNVSLTKELEELVNRKVGTGRYLSASEVVREALRLLEERDRLQEIRVEEMRRAIRAGNEQLARGERVPGEAVFGEIREKSRQRRRKKG
jgi:antitoxin ParD1/3/4